MLINKTKRAEQNLNNLPFLALQAEQIEFLGSSAEFKTQIIELIRNAKKRIYVTALYWQKDEAGQEILDEIYRVKQENPHLDVKILIDWHRAQRNLLGRKNLPLMQTGIASNAKLISYLMIRICSLACQLIREKFLVYCMSKALYLMIRCFIAVQVLIMSIFINLKISLRPLSKNHSCRIS